MLCGGKRISDSCFEATVLFVPGDCKVSQAEIFGPVACVYSVENVDAAIARANDVPFPFRQLSSLEALTPQCVPTDVSMHCGNGQ